MEHDPPPASARIPARRPVRGRGRGLPTGAVAQVLRGVVDNAGTADPTPNTAVVATLSATDLAAGVAAVPVDTTAPSFFRTQVVDGSTGDILAFGQPIWSLPSAPPNGVPPARQPNR